MPHSKPTSCFRICGAGRRGDLSADALDKEMDDYLAKVATRYISHILFYSFVLRIKETDESPKLPPDMNYYLSASRQGCCPAALALRHMFSRMSSVGLGVRLWLFGAAVAAVVAPCHISGFGDGRALVALRRLQRRTQLRRLHTHTHTHTNTHTHTHTNTHTHEHTSDLCLIHISERTVDVRFVKRFCVWICLV